MTYLNLGKIGDLISLLPILHDDFKRTGQKPTLIVSREYAPILDRIDYIQPHIWNGDWQDLRGAYVYAKQRFNGVIVPQIFGKDFPIAKRTPSFQLDQWLRAGRLEDWDKLPMIIPRQANPRRQWGQKTGKPIIAYADHSQSSPFTRKDELHRLLVDYLGATHEIIRLSEVRMAHPLDLLALFDEADALVTVETMMLHLSAASKIPTVALIADSPTRWKGSAWSKRFLAHIRYCDYENRKEDIIRAVKAGVNKSDLPRLELFKTANENAYNASIMRHGDNVLISSRHHPDVKSWRTAISIYDGRQSCPVSVPRFNDHSIEDLRLFQYQGKPYGSFTIAKSGKGFSPCVCAYGELDFTGSTWQVRNLKITKYGRNDFSWQEKNWSYFEHQGKLYATYENSPNHVVLEIEGDRVIKEYKTPSPTCDYGSVRGGTVPVPYQSQLLRFCHALQRNERSDQYWTYHITAQLMEPQPPFTITRISSHPIMTGNEQYFHGWSRWKPRVLIPYGAITITNGWRLTVGVNDSACGIVDLKECHLNLLTQ